MRDNSALEYLLDLHGTKYVIDDELGLWVKFEAWRVDITNERPHGIRYSLTLHNRRNERLLGFDNAHAIEYGKKNFVAAKRVYDHYHRDEKDTGKPYQYDNAGKLLEDFWDAVEAKIEQIKDRRIERLLK